MIDVGVSVVEITPPAGLAMSGFAARNEPATGAHDPLTVRALVVGDTAIVIADVIGIDAALSNRVRQNCKLNADAVTIAATHTHGGPPSMPGRLATTPDAAFLQKLERSLIKAIDDAVENKKPAKIFGGVAVDPGYAKNRRHESGPVDQMIPVLRFDDSNGTPIAIFVSYACHPVVLGADNLQWTADYVHFVRKELETAYPGAIAIFATGCAGDVNTGHTAAASMSKQSNPDRTFAAAARMGAKIADSIKAARLSEMGASVGHSEAQVSLNFSVTEPASAGDLAKDWQTKAEQEHSDIYRIWAEWARTTMGNTGPLLARCSALNWGGISIVALPGEIFAKTALGIRKTLAKDLPNFVLCYADDNPGYIPPASEYEHGGYEIEEAHRFYGLGAAFAPGSAEHLAKTGSDCARMAEVAATKNNSTKPITTNGERR